MQTAYQKYYELQRRQGVEIQNLITYMYKNLKLVKRSYESSLRLHYNLTKNLRNVGKLSTDPNSMSLQNRRNQVSRSNPLIDPSVVNVDKTNEHFKRNKLTAGFPTTSDTSLCPIHNSALHPETGTMVISGLYKRVYVVIIRTRTRVTADGDK